MSKYRKGWTKGPLEVRQAKHPVDGAYDFAIGADLNDHKVCIAETFGRGDQDVWLPAEANACLFKNAERLFEALEALLADFGEMVRDPDLLQMAMELARSGRPLEFDSDGGPETVRNARAALLAADGQDEGR